MPTPQEEDYGAFSPPDQSGLADQWNGFLADPRGRAALASFGVQLMQPLSAGQSGVGHVGAALGQAGESVRGTEAADLKLSEAESKNELRGSQAATAEARANTAATRAAALNSETDSKIALRGAQGDAARSRAANLEMKTKQLEALVAVFPEDQEAKRRLLEAKTQLSQAQAEAVPYDSETKRQAVEDKYGIGTAMVDVKNRDADTRRAAVDSRNTLGTERNAISADRNAVSREGQLNRRTNVATDSENSRNERNRTSNILRAQAQYQRATKEIAARNKDPLRDRKLPEEPVPSFQDWITANPAVRDALKLGAAPPPAPPSTPSATPPSAAATPPVGGSAASAIPIPSQRIPGNVYPTPKGPMKWTGTGWIAP